MADRLSPDTCTAIRALCKKISVAHHLDAEIQEELYDHMEDKLIAYLDGQEALTEEDAVILVREHFGDPSAIKGLLQDVHAYEADVSLARRLAAALIATTGISVVCLCLASAVLLLWPPARGLTGFLAMYAATGVLSAIVSWLLLWYWQRRLDTGHTPWFITRRPAYFVGSIVILLILQSFVPIPQPHISSAPAALARSADLLRLILIVTVVSPVLNCMAWLWWCDRPPRKVRAVASAAGLWIIWMWLSSSVRDIRRIVLILHSSHATPWSSIAKGLGFSFLFLVIYALVAFAVYGMARYAGKGFMRWVGARR